MSGRELLVLQKHKASGICLLRDAHQIRSDGDPPERDAAAVELLHQGHQEC